MSPTILCSVKEKLQKSSVINTKKIDILIKHMERWNNSNIIYPSRIKSLLHSTYKETYQVLDLIESMGILKYNYEIYCSACEKFLDIPRLESLNQFPNEQCCEFGHELNPFRDTVLVYKVIKDE